MSILSVNNIITSPNKNEDSLAEAFQSDKSFQVLLRNGRFDDYFNTFLSLPIFAKRLMYKRDNAVFDIEPPVKRTTHHLLHDKVITWTRINRAPLFLKTPICNEYRLSEVLASLPISWKDEHYTEEELLEFHRKYLSKVIDMQRMKKFLHKSIGESLILFWLDAERYRRQVPVNCHRFVLREIVSKYIVDGAPHELNKSLRDEINEYLKMINSKQYQSHKKQHRQNKQSRIEEQQAQQIQKSSQHSITPPSTQQQLSVQQKSFKPSQNQQRLWQHYLQELETCSLESWKILIPMQELVIESLRTYWIPKFINHRLRRRYTALGKWSTIAKKKLNLSIDHKLLKIAELVNQVNDKQETNIDEEIKNIPNETCQLSGSSTSSDEEDLTLAKLQKTAVISASSSTSSSRASLNSGNLTLNSGKEKPDDHIKCLIQKRKQQISIESIEKLEITHTRDKTVNRKRRKSKNSKREIPVTPANFHGGTKKKLRVGICGASPEESRETKTETKIVDDSSDEDSTRKIRLPPLKQPFADDRAKTQRKTTLFEALHLQREADYEADTEADVEEKREIILKESMKEIRLPVISTIESASNSYIAPLIHVNYSKTRVKSPFTKTFLKANTLSFQLENNKRFQILNAALTTDSVAGSPLVEHFKKSGDQAAEANLKFWNAANQVLTDKRSHEPITRTRQFRALVNLYLTDNAECKISLEPQTKKELADLLLKDLGMTKLMEACDIIAWKLMPAWEDFLRNDEETFLNYATKCKRMDRANKYRQDTIIIGLDDDNEFDGTFDADMFNFNYFFEEKEKGNFSSLRMWRAVQLAVAICRPDNTDNLPDVNEESKWTTDDNANDDDNGDSEGSLSVRNLHLLNRRAQRMNQEKLENLFNTNAANLGLVHDYNGVVGNFNKYYPESSGNEGDTYDQSNRMVNNDLKNRRQSQLRPPKPRNFYDILSDSTQFDFFKRFLMREQAETPLLFWAAIESMRTMSKSAKARQGRAHGIVKRYLGPSTDYGKQLNCEADVLKEIRQMEKVPPAMLLSAQTCVAKSMEEMWFTKYLQTFQQDGGVMGINLLPIYGQNKEAMRCVKQKSRGLWRMFTRNVISFRRGIMGTETLKMFQDFLKLQHQLNVAQFQATNLDPPNANILPPRIVVNNKLIYTEKLNADLAFWSEVERYKDFADAVVLCAKLGNYTKDDELIVVKKASTIVDCFIDSQISPRIQINISSELADNIINLVQNGIIERGLFHEAALSTFSTLIHFWKKFCLYRFLPKEPLPVKKMPRKSERSAQIEIKQQAIRAHKMKKICLPPEEDCPKIMFSLQLGLRLALQRQGRRRKQVGLSIENTSPMNGIFTASYINTTPVKF